MNSIIKTAAKVARALTNCGECNEAEVSGIQQFPVLPSPEKKCAADDVSDH